MRAILLAVLIGLTAEATHAADLPPWVRDAAASAAVDAKAPATVLLDEIAVTVNGGRAVSTHRYIVRVRELGGRGAAAMQQVYVNDSGRITDTRAWIQSARGEVRQLGGKDTIDVAVAGNDVYNEVRVRGFDATREVEGGGLFAAEIVSEEPVLFAQFDWTLQDRWPVTRVRRSLTLPAGWRAQSVTFNASAIEPTVRGTTHTWEAGGLPAVVEEPFAPPLSQLVARLAVSYFAPASSKAAGQFADWREVASWMASMSDAASLPSDAVTRVAREVTAGTTSEIDKIRAVAGFVQRIHYVSIQTGIGRGGGYQPHPAALVLDKRYGDCKDKAALMRAMLAAVGVRAFLVAIYSGDPWYVRREWPSPQQFNHCIVAIALAQPLTDAATLPHPTLGPLLIFDPTAEHTALGDLPTDEQGSFALIQAAGGTLERMPVARARGGRIERRVTAASTARARCARRSRIARRAPRPRCSGRGWRRRAPPVSSSTCAASSRRSPRAPPSRAAGPPTTAPRIASRSPSTSTRPPSRRRCRRA